MWARQGRASSRLRPEGRSPALARSRTAPRPASESRRLLTHAVAPNAPGPAPRPGLDRPCEKRRGSGLGLVRPDHRQDHGRYDRSDDCGPHPHGEHATACKHSRLPTCSGQSTMRRIPHQGGRQCRIVTRRTRLSGAVQHHRPAILGKTDSGDVKGDEPSQAIEVTNHSA